jgi:hypothetical protein
MDTPLRGAVRVSVARSAAALEAASTPELLVASEQELRELDSPYAAAFILSALADAPEYPRSAAQRLVRYLLESREPSGLWRPWTASPPLEGTGTSARALLALERWKVKEVDAGRALEGLLTTARPEGEDLMASVDVLALATHLGQEPRELAATVAARLEAQGLEAYSRQPFISSPFAFAHALGHWLRYHEDAQALRRLVWRECTRRRDAAMRNALDCALTLSTLLLLGPARGEPAWEQRLDDMVSLLLREQSDIGLWPALPLFTDASGQVYGSPQLTTAACLEALSHYMRRWEAALPGSASAEEPASTLARGHRAAASRKQRELLAPPRLGTWGDTLDALEGMVPPALVSPEAMATIRSIARWLPAALTDGFGIECRLAEHAPRADVFFWINSDSRGRDILAGEEPRSELREELLREPLWRSIREFSRQWADPGSPLYQGVDSFWLEFDVGAQPPALPLPVLFFCPEEVPVPEEPTGARQARKRHQALSTEALRALGGGTLSGETLRNVGACIEALPPGSQPFAIGVMRSRRMDTVRFCAKDIPAQGLLAYLTAVGWKGPRAELEALLDWLARHVDRFVLDFDVGGEVLPSVGLECSFQGRKQPAAEPRWATLLEELVRRGLCLSEKRDALLAWPGLSSCVEQGGGEVRDSRFDRRLSHLKLSLKPELEAKGYLGAWRYFEAKRAS